MATDDLEQQFAVRRATRLLSKAVGSMEPEARLRRLLAARPEHHPRHAAEGGARGAEGGARAYGPRVAPVRHLQLETFMSVRQIGRSSVSPLWDEGPERVFAPLSPAS